MRSLFDQYQQPENRLTHALVCTLAEDGPLLRRFIRWATGSPAPAGRLQIVEQQRPGEPGRSETEAAGIPDAWIYCDGGWALLIESKISASLDSSQLQRHLATAARRGFDNATLLTLTARAEAPSNARNIVDRTWTSLYSWLLRQHKQSKWAGRCASYMEVLEANLIEQGYLKEGTLTSFSGIPFDSENPYNYLEAKRLLKLALNDLRGSSRLRRQMGMDPDAPGRGAITGREGAAVWDFLRLRQAGRDERFTKFPHLTLAIEHERAIAIVTVPHGIRTDFRRSLVDLGSEGFGELLRKLNDRLLAALQGDKGAAPMIIVVQRRYLTQRSSAIVDARLEFDLRTAFQESRRGARAVVKVQPQWMDATFGALANKRSNLQLAIGASFPFGRSSSVGDKTFVDRVAGTWIACSPLLAAMGISKTRE